MSENFTPTQRVMLGTISATMLVVGSAMYGLFPQSNQAVAAILIRVGTVLSVVWLAFPELKKIGQRLPTLAVGGLLLGLVLMAARPNLFKVAAALMILLTALSLIAKVLRKG